MGIKGRTGEYGPTSQLGWRGRGSVIPRAELCPRRRRHMERGVSRWRWSLPLWQRGVWEPQPRAAKTRSVGVGKASWPGGEARETPKEGSSVSQSKPSLLYTPPRVPLASGPSAFLMVHDSLQGPGSAEGDEMCLFPSLTYPANMGTGVGHARHCPRH